MLPAFLMPLVTKFGAIAGGVVLPFLRQYWKPIAAVLAVLAAFAIGWQVNGWRLNRGMEHARADAAEAVTAAVLKREAEMRLEFEQNQTKVEAVATTLATRLAQVEVERNRVTLELATAKLTKPRVIKLKCGDPNADDTPDDANPFSEEFVARWNRSAAAVRERVPSP